MPRADLPHRATLGRFLGSVDRPCLEAVRTLFEQYRFAEGWTSETIGGSWDRQGRRSIVFDVDATRQAARQRALPCDPTLPSPRRRLNGGLCARLHRAKARGGGTYAHHSSQRCRLANGSARMRAEAMATIKVNSARALRAITTYLRLFVLTTQVALVRLDEQYGDTVAIAQLIGAGVHLVTRARGYPRPGAPIRSNACWLTHQPRG